MAKDFTKVYDENARLKAEFAILKDEYTCEECEECFVDKETGINEPSICMSCWNAMVTKLRAEIDKKEDALTRIDTWAKAYPLDIFPKPDLKRAAEVLKASGMTLDSISADNMRHVLDDIKDIVSEALKGATDGVQDESI